MARRRDAARRQEFAAKQFPHRAPPETHATGGSKATPLRPIVVSDKTGTFAEIVQKMDDGNIHRVWVCSHESVEREAPRPLRAISQQDVLFAVCHYIGALK